MCVHKECVYHYRHVIICVHGQVGVKTYEKYDTGYGICHIDVIQQLANMLFSSQHYATHEIREVSISHTYREYEGMYMYI